MRTLTAAQTNVLGLTNRSTHVRVQIDRGSSDWIDMRDLEGRDWLESAEYGDSIDSPVQSARIQLRKKVDQLNLAPLVDGSKLNQGGTIISLNNPVVIETATVGQDAEPELTDWKEVFRGTISEIDWGAPQISLRCRDQGALLVDTFMETQQQFGAAAPGDDIEDVVQDILDAHVGSVTLYSPNGTGGTPFNPSDSPGFKILPYKNSKATVMSELRKLARLIGYEVKYKWHDNTSAFQLQLFSPGRPLRARGSLLLTGQPLNNETSVINATTVTAKTSGASTDEFNIGSSLGDTAANLAAAISAGTEKTDVVAWRVTEGANQRVIYEWKTAGTVGNSITFTESMTNTAADGGGTLGGFRAGTGLSSSSYTFDQDHYFKIPQLKLALPEIRNAMRCTFTEQPSGLRLSLVSDDPASIDKYDRRYMEITEGASSQIDTFTEAGNMLESALSDLAEPIADQSLEAPYFWPGEPQDLYTFTANGVHYDTDQDLAVSRIKHKLSQGSARTVLETRGKPSGGLNRWLEVEGRPGVAPPSDLAPIDVAAGVAAGTALGTITVDYDDPRTMSPPVEDWSITKVYAVDENDGGYPDFTPSASNLVAGGRQTHFEVGNLTPGILYAVKLQILDGVGNVGTTSTQVIKATQQIGPYHENPNGQFDQLVRNPDLNIFTLGDGFPPDFWSSNLVWGVASPVYFTTVTVFTGDRAITMNVASGQEPYIRSDFIPFSEGDLIVAGAMMQGNVAPGNTSVNIEVDYHNANKAFISRGSTNMTVANGSFEERNSAIFQTPTNTRFVKVTVEGKYIGTNYTLIVDRIGAAREHPILDRNTVPSSFPWTANGQLITIDYVNQGSDEIGITWDAVNKWWYVDIPGTYIVGYVSVFVSSLAPPQAYTLNGFIEIDTGSGFVTVGQAQLPTDSNSTARLVFQSPLQELDVGDTIRIQASLTGAATPTNVFLLSSFAKGRSFLRPTR